MISRDKPNYKIEKTIYATIQNTGHIKPVYYVSANHIYICLYKYYCGKGILSKNWPTPKSLQKQLHWQPKSQASTNQTIDHPTNKQTSKQTIKIGTTKSSFLPNSQWSQTAPWWRPPWRYVLPCGTPQNAPQCPKAGCLYLPPGHLNLGKIQDLRIWNHPAIMVVI